MSAQIDEALVEMSVMGLGDEEMSNTCCKRWSLLTTLLLPSLLCCAFSCQAIAQLTAAQQLCRTLLVSDKARVTVMPSMEIIANDVTCTHGATITDLEDEELFYLMTRGISKMMVRVLNMAAAILPDKCRLRFHIASVAAEESIVVLWKLRQVVWKHTTPGNV